MLSREGAAGQSSVLDVEDAASFAELSVQSKTPSLGEEFLEFGTQQNPTKTTRQQK